MDTLWSLLKTVWLLNNLKVNINKNKQIYNNANQLIHYDVKKEEIPSYELFPF